MQAAAGQVPAANPLNAPAVRYYSFGHDLFGDPSKDPWNGQYQHLLAPFDIDINNGAHNMQPAQVRETLTNSTQNLEPIATILLHQDVARVYLLPVRMSSTLGVQYPAHIDGRMFALDGDLHRNCPLVVELPDNLFNMTANQLQVPTVPHITAQLAADPALTIMGPYNPGDANTEVVRTRSIVTVPFAYAQLFLASERMSPRMYFEQVYPAILNDGNAQSCLPLTRFFQLSITDNGQGTSTLNVPNLPTGSRSNHLLAKYDRLIRSHFPQLDTNLQQLQNTQIASQIAQLTQAYQQGRLEDTFRREEKANTPISSWLGERVATKLLHYCAVPAETQLPAIWTQLAKAKHSDRLQVLQAAVSQKKVEMNQPHLQFAVTLPLLTTITSMDWEMVSKDSIETGLQPFRCFSSDDEAAMTHQQQVQLLLTGTSASLEDTNRLLAGNKLQLPTNLNFSLFVLRISLLMQILLPAQHPLVSFLNELYQDLESYRHHIGGFVTSQPSLNGSATGILICKWLANTLSNYYTLQGNQDGLVPIGRRPNDISTAITMESSWEPLLSSAFIQKYKIREFCGALGSTPPGPRPSSIAAGPSGPSPPSRPQTAQNRRLNNPDWSESLFKTFSDRQVKTLTIRQLITAGKITSPLPRSKVSPALVQCLGYHTKGQCNTACVNAHDHVNYTVAELAPLAQWCQECYPADQATAVAALAS